MGECIPVRPLLSPNTKLSVKQLPTLVLFTFKVSTVVMLYVKSYCIIVLSFPNVLIWIKFPNKMHNRSQSFHFLMTYLKQNYAAMFFLCITSVAPPMVTIMPLPNPVYAGTRLVVTCLIQLNSAVDTGVAINSTWRRDALQLNSTADITDFGINQNGSSLYYAQLVFSILPLDIDHANYSCEVSVAPSPSSLFILSSPLISDQTSFHPAGLFTCGGMVWVGYIFAWLLCCIGVLIRAIVYSD